MTNLTSLKMKINEKVRPDDIIAALFLGLENKKIIKDPEKIHKAIFHLNQQKEEYENLLKEIKFDISGITPYSRILDQILFRLETTGLLGTLNPKYERYDLSECDDWKRKVYNKLSPEQKDVIQEMCNEFEEFINN